MYLEVGYSSNIIRGLRSIGCIRADNPIFTLSLRGVTFANVLAKMLLLMNKKLGLHLEWPFSTAWPFSTVRAMIKFMDIHYKFICAKNMDYIKFLNPYYHEYEICYLVHGLIQKGDIFIDVGAHGGLYAIIAGKLAGQEGKVICLEPNPYNYCILKQNIIINNLSNNIFIFPKAASDTKGVSNLYFSIHSTALSSLRTEPSARRKIKVNTTTIDEVCNSQVPERKYIKFLKIDTEGYDLNVLKGSKKTLQRTKVVVVEESSSPIVNLLKESGFYTHIMKPSGYLFAHRR